MLIVGFIIWVTVGVICGLIANAKGRSVPGWVVLGFIFPLIALLIIAFLPSLKAQAEAVPATAEAAALDSSAAAASAPASPPPIGTLSISQDLGAGLFLIALAAIAFFGTTNLHFGQGPSVGPGMMPRAVSVALAAFGVLFLAQGSMASGTRMDRWSIRGPFFVLGAALVFAWTIRPLGVIVAGPLAVMIASMADKDTRLIEVVPYAIIITLACIGLFSYGLRLPMPVTPSAIPYPLDQWL